MLRPPLLGTEQGNHSKFHRLIWTDHPRQYSSFNDGLLYSLCWLLPLHKGPWQRIHVRSPCSFYIILAGYMQNQWAWLLRTWPYLLLCQWLSVRVSQSRLFSCACLLIPEVTCLMIRCCGTCGKVLDQDVYTEEPNFVKDASGQVGFASMLFNIWVLLFHLLIVQIKMFWGAI